MSRLEELEMNTTMKECGVIAPSVARRLGKRFDDIAMALVLIMTGVLWLVPKAMFPEGTWLAGLGLILLGLNAARRIRGIKTSGFGIVAGLIAAAAGIGRIFGLALPIIPALLIVLGAVLVVKAATARGNTEDGSGAL
jgi:hypothetical protein